MLSSLPSMTSWSQKLIAYNFFLLTWQKIGNSLRSLTYSLSGNFAPVIEKKLTSYTRSGLFLIILSLMLLSESLLLKSTYTSFCNWRSTENLFGSYSLASMLMMFLYTRGSLMNENPLCDGATKLYPYLMACLLANPAIIIDCLNNILQSSQT